MVTTNWRELETRVKSLFRSCGCRAVKAVVRGPGKVKYEIDCLVTFKSLGLPTKWIVECKNWGSRVPQDVAASLRQRVTDTGADKGILVCPSGFQLGTINQAEISSLALVTLDELEETLWVHLRQLLTEMAFKQIRDVRDQITTYRLRLEDYLYAHEAITDVHEEHEIYQALGLWFSALAGTQVHLEQWEAGRPSIGPPAKITDSQTHLVGKTDFRDDRHMLRHVMGLISQARRRVGRVSGIIASLPDSPTSPVAPSPLKGPRYFPRPPRKT
jgi:restriction endonuclease